MRERQQRLVTLTCTSSPMTDLLSILAHLPTEEPHPMMLSDTRAKSFTCICQQVSAITLFCGLQVNNTGPTFQRTAITLRASE